MSFSLQPYTMPEISFTHYDLVSLSESLLSSMLTISLSSNMTPVPRRYQQLRTANHSANNNNNNNRNNRTTTTATKATTTTKAATTRTTTTTTAQQQKQQQQQPHNNNNSKNKSHKNNSNNNLHVLHIIRVNHKFHRIYNWHRQLQRQIPDLIFSLINTDKCIGDTMYQRITKYDV